MDTLVVSVMDKQEPWMERNNLPYN